MLSGMDAQLREEYEVLRIRGKLNMRYWDDRTLQTECHRVAAHEFGAGLEEFSGLLLKTLESHGNGIGLAANQVGLTQRLFAIEFEEDGFAPFVMVNPVITRRSVEMEAGVEGCLSLPTIYDQVMRHKAITVEFQYPDGKDGKYDLEDLNARVVQHEIDHLDGLMFFDRMSRQMKKNVLRQWDKIRDKYE